MYMRRSKRLSRMTGVGMCGSRTERELRRFHPAATIESYGGRGSSGLYDGCSAQLFVLRYVPSKKACPLPYFGGGRGDAAGLT